ncbi:TonB-dependent receptor plug domain-containing protein [Lysobacter arvi]|uniref:TonB-dependent receptor n=1 Tax=Lysobacter arvi TaxID=3038776 RepID=A0ABU1CIN9_9GAMM|nr:TonB-dependent receptor [Lysobacter arvi]MDR0184809.1 TonB-dependent receptor [Lysobacter arvi]
MKHRNMRTVVRVGLLPAGIAVALAPAFAFAQDSDKDATTLDKIEVTGSRIRQASMETSQPVISLSRADIQKQGFTSVADIIQNLSAAGSPAISRADALSSGEEVGGQYVDLRNLGPERTLVLVDGKRMGVSSGGYSDLAAIPTSIVERIEVLTDGASALYGSDAIAGVINIITRKNFDGAEASAYIGQYGQGDGEKQVYNFMIGSAGERSSVALGAEYTKEDEVRAGDRPFSASSNGTFHPGAVLVGPGWTVDAHGTSAISANGVISNGPCGGGLPPSEEIAATRCGIGLGNSWTVNPGADPRDFANYHPTSAEDFANSNQQMWLQTALERRSLFANARFDLTDSVRFVADALYTHREAEQQIAGYPYRSAAYGTPMSADSYFNPLGRSVSFSRRTWEVPRNTVSELTTYRFTGGFEGSFDLADKPWDWDVGYVYNQNKGVKTGTGNLFVPNVEQAVGPSFLDTDGVVKCGSPGAAIDGCVPWNPLSRYGANDPGNLSNAELQKYLFLPSHDTSETTTQVYSANLSGVLAELEAGDLGMAVGYEHRKESARYEPDALQQSGLSTDLAGAPTQGGYSLDEVYLEFNVPILADVAFAKELSLDVAGRYSDYSTFGDTTNTKFGLKWKPTDDLLFRGTYGTGFRAPTVNDLYGGTSETFDQYTDPCDTSFGAASRNGAVASRCAADVPGGFRQEASGGVAASGPNTQSNYAYLSGSNPELKPETSKTYTVGMVYSPTWAEGLDIGLDWWKIRVDDVIAAETVTSILNQYYVQDIATAGSRFVRDADSGQVVDVTRTLINAGYQETAGYDFSVSYRLPETSFGRFRIDWKSTYVDYLEYKRDNEDVTPVEQRNGWVTGDWGGNFRIRSNMMLDWNLGDFGASWTARYYSSAKEPCAYDLSGGPECNNPDFSSAYTLEQPTQVRGSNTFHDVQFRYNTPWNATVSLGANNVFNHLGPTMYSDPSSSFSYYGGFDIGRFWYLKYQQRF